MTKTNKIFESSLYRTLKFITLRIITTIIVDILQAISQYNIAFLLIVDTYSILRRASNTLNNQFFI